MAPKYLTKAPPTTLGSRHPSPPPPDDRVEKKKEEIESVKQSLLEVVSHVQNAQITQQKTYDSVFPMFRREGEDFLAMQMERSRVLRRNQQRCEENQARINRADAAAEAMRARQHEIVQAMLNSIAKMTEKCCQIESLARSHIMRDEEACERLQLQCLFAEQLVSLIQDEKRREETKRAEAMRDLDRLRAELLEDEAATKVVIDELKCRRAAVDVLREKCDLLQRRKRPRQ